MASYVADHIRVICPSGLLRSTNSFPMNLSLLVQRKVTKRKDTPISLPFGSPQHSPLPTGRPDSPSGLDMTKSGVLPDFPYQRRMLRQTSWGQNLTSVVARMKCSVIRGSYAGSNSPGLQCVGCNSEAYCTDNTRRITAKA